MALDTTSTEPTDRYVRLFVRADSPQPVRRERTVERLTTLAERGRIDSFGVTTWSSRVALDGNDEALAAFETFERWADAAGVSVRPPFVVREEGTTFVGDRYAVLLTPALCAALYEDGDLVAVAPHVDSGDAVDVDDLLAALEDEADPTPARSTTRLRPPTTDPEVIAR